MPINKKAGRGGGGSSNGGTHSHHHSTPGGGGGGGGSNSSAAAGPATATGRCQWAKEHMFKLIFVVILLLLAAQYVTNLFVYVETDALSLSLWKQLPVKFSSIIVFKSSSNSGNSSRPSGDGVGSSGNATSTAVPSGRTKPILLVHNSTSTSSIIDNVSSLSSTNVTSVRRVSVARTSGYPLLTNEVATYHHTVQLPSSPNTLSPTALSPTPTVELEPCPAVPPNLVGALNVTFEKKTFSELEELHTELGEDSGGHWKPPHCVSRSKVAIILPFRDRHEQLQIFLTHMHPFLQKQELDYSIYVIDQAKGSLFNRALLMNIGYVEAVKDYPWECFIFHDVDLIPENDNNVYSCPPQPRHMSVSIDVFGYKLPYSDIFGGVSALTREQFEKINGFSNSFWGWGGEDDDLANRVKKRGRYHITRYKADIARYRMIKHGHEVTNKANPKRFQLLYQGYKRFAVDGINSVKYTLLQRELRQLYTWVYVNVTQPRGL